MRILFDQGTPRPLRQHLRGHSVDVPYEMGWSELTNGELLTRADNAGYDILLTTDRNIRHQQDLSTRRIALVVLLSANWNQIQNRIPEISAAIDRVQPGGYEEITF